MKGRILLIEDNDQNAYLVEFLLGERGWTIIQATEGSTGLKLADRETPDLILLDIQLPGMDGYEVARMLRSKKHLEETPIIAVTSYAMPGDRESCLAAGCTGYIEKPIDPGSFADQVEQYLGKRP